MDGHDGDDSKQSTTDMTVFLSQIAMNPYYHHDSSSEAHSLQGRGYRHPGVGSSRGQQGRNPSTDRVTEFLVDELLRVRNRGPSLTEDRDTIWRYISAQNPPQFTGEGDPTFLEEWIREFEKLFAAVRCPDNWRVDYAVYYLKGDADAWWQTVQDLAQAPGFNWERFTQLLRDRYYSEQFKDRKEEELITLRQGDRTVVEYAVEFTKLLQYVPSFYHTEKKKKNQFIRGLNQRLKTAIAAMRFDTFQDLYEAVVNQERSFNEAIEEMRAQQSNRGGKRSSQSSYSGSGSRNRPTFQMPFQVNPLSYDGSSKRFRGQTSQYCESSLSPGSSQRTVSGPRGRSKDLCHRCGLPGHFARDCRTAILTCFNCGETGHKSSNCPEKMTVSGSRDGPPSKHSTGSTNRPGGRVFFMDPLAAQQSGAVVTGPKSSSADAIKVPNDV